MKNQIIDRGYNGNTNLRKSGVVQTWTQDMMEEWVKCSQDPIYFAEKYIQIVHVDHGLIPIKLYEFQKDLILSSFENRRTVACTGRQQGKTTTAVCIILHFVLFNDYKTVALLANKGDSAREILSRIQTAYEALPKWLQQGVTEWNKGSVEFENGCKILAGATSSSAIRGKSCLSGETRICVEDESRFFYVEMEFINKSRFFNKENSTMSNNCDLYTVYKTINKESGKEYIGFHGVNKNKGDDLICSYNENGSIFKCGYLGSGKLIKKALEKYSPSAFSQQLLFSSPSKEEAENFEKNLVDENYVSREDTYNISIGGNVCILNGESNGFYGKKHDQKTIDAIQEKLSELRDSDSMRTFGSFFDENGQLYNSLAKYNKKLRLNLSKIEFYNLVKEGKFNPYSERYHTDILERLETYLLEETQKPEKIEKHKDLVSKRFKGVSKSEDHKKKIGEGVSSWIDNNRDSFVSRIEKINKDPEKIRKTAEKHTGMKRSDEARKKMAEAKKGKTPGTKDTVGYHNPETNQVIYLKSESEVPNGFVKGLPKRKYRGVAYTNGKTIKFFVDANDVPAGWVKGRKFPK